MIGDLIRNKSFQGYLKGRWLRRALLGLASFTSAFLFLRITFFTRDSVSNEAGTGTATGKAKTLGPSNTFVVSSQQKDDISWIVDNLKGWDVTRYVVDDRNAKFAVPKNKGREAMVYLTYIIDTYNDLPDLMVFIHPDRYQWHNDDPIYDGVPMLQNLQIPYLLAQGYTNIRCVWTLGCPSELTNLDQPLPTVVEDEKSALNTRLHLPAAFKVFFPDTPIPPTIAVACCAQFAVTRSKIHERPVQDYQRYRDWLLNTPLPDHVSGRVFEYTWHMIFGQEAMHCPSAKECYCKVFGYCNLVCDGDGQKGCGDRWPFPSFASLPTGWPFVSWKGTRTVEEVAAARLVAMEGSNGTSVNATAAAAAATATATATATASAREWD